MYSGLEFCREHIQCGFIPRLRADFCLRWHTADDIQKPKLLRRKQPYFRVRQTLNTAPFFGRQYRQTRQTLLQRLTLISSLVLAMVAFAAPPCWGTRVCA